MWVSRRPGGTPLNRSIFAPIALLLGIGLSACGGGTTVADDGSDGQPPNVPSGQAGVEEGGGEGDAVADDGSDGQPPNVPSGRAEDGGGEHVSTFEEYSSLEELFSNDRTDELIFLNGQQAGLQLCQDVWGSPADVLEALGKDAPPEGLPDMAWTEFYNEDADEEFRKETDDPYSASPYFMGYDDEDPERGWHFRCHLSYKYDGESLATAGVLYLNLDSINRQEERQDSRYFYYANEDVEFTITMVPGGEGGVDVDSGKGVAYLKQVSDRLPESQG